MNGACSGTARCPNVPNAAAHDEHAVQWEWSIMEVRHART